MTTHLFLNHEEARREASSRLDPSQRRELGQYLTPAPIASFMASLFRDWPLEVKVLDPGAGIGSLTQALVDRLLQSDTTPRRISATAFEIDSTLLKYLSEHMRTMKIQAKERSVDFEFEIDSRDFIHEATFEIGMGAKPIFTHAILNPPYKKINSNSVHRALLSGMGIETVNLYTAFLGLAVAMTQEKGEIVAIVPRSFCNGTYFRPFRQWLLKHASIRHIHVFERRDRAFKDDEVLQENIIIHLIRGGTQKDVIISTSNDATFSNYKQNRYAFEKIVKESDNEKFIHIPLSCIEEPMGLFKHSLKEIGLEVSTGPVVDFRVRDHWLLHPIPDCAPMIYTHHFLKGKFIWPRRHKKPNALLLNEHTFKWLMPKGFYCITKRFSSKEERRRIVAYVIDPKWTPYSFYGFENHLNVFHCKKNGLTEVVARGLAVFLNSSVLEQYFRSFSGHTQVNATDLRAIRYPGERDLLAFGKWSKRHHNANQTEIDTFINDYAGKQRRQD